MSTWLNRQTKKDLQEIAEELGIDVDGNKHEVVSILDDFLSSNKSDNERVAPYYSTSRRHASSPVKREAESPGVVTALEDVQQVGEIVKRRATQVFEEVKAGASNAVEVVQKAIQSNDSDSDEISSPRTRSTSRQSQALVSPRVRELANQVPLPPSPSVVANYIDEHTQSVRHSIAEVYQESGVTEFAEELREKFSSALAIQILTIAYEVWCLRPELLPDTYGLFTFPSFYGSTPKLISLPDLFLLLSREFWGPATLWVTTTLAIPLFIAYFFNLTKTPHTRRNSKTRFNYSFDPLTFNVVKALLVYVIFEQDFTFGDWVDLEYVARINSSLYGGPMSVVLGCGIGIMVTFYEAIISK